MVGVHIVFILFIMYSVVGLIVALRKKAKCETRDKEIESDIRMSITGIIISSVLYGVMLLVVYGGFFD